MYVFLISLRLSIRVVHMGQFFWPDPILPVTLRTRPDPSPLPTLRHTVGLKCGLNGYDSSLFRKYFSITHALAVVIANQRMLMNNCCHMMKYRYTRQLNW